MKADRSSFQSILIYRLGSLGDTLVALPCLRSVRTWYPNAKITLLTNLPVHATKARRTAEVLDGTGLIDSVIDYPRGTRSFGELKRIRDAVREKAPDIAIHLSEPRGRVKTLRDALFLRWCGARKIVGLPWRVDETGSTQEGTRTVRVPAEAERLARRLARLGTIDLADRSLWDLGLLDSERSAATRQLEASGIRTPFIVVSIGTKSQANDWTVPNWSRALASLSNQLPDLGLIAIGSPDERERSDELLRVWQGPRANLCGALAVRESGALLERALLFVGHDSGPMHLAASVGTRCLAVFSARCLPGRWFPGGDGHHVFYNPVACRGCGLETCIEQAKKCILGIAPDAVAARAAGMIQERIRGSTGATTLC